MVPKYCYRVEATYRRFHTEANRISTTHTSNHETLSAAWEARIKILARPNTKRVSIVMVLDETTRGEE